MPTLNAFLANLNTSVNVDDFDIFDNVSQRALPPLQIQGGQQAPFTIDADGTGTGDVWVTDVGTGRAVQFSFIRDGDVLNM